MKIKFEDSKKYFKYIVSIICLFFLCYMFPYSGDDWAWGSSIGMERLSDWFDNYSGRYVGNLIVLVLTRSNFFKAFTMSISIIGIVFCIEKIVKRKYAFWISLALISILPRMIFVQSIVWTSGFSNYTTSILFTLIYIVYINDLFYDDKKIEKKYKVWHALPLFVLGIINTLIVEHLTIYNIILAVFVIIITVIKNHKIYISNLSYFLGTVLGTYLMFSNSVYHTIRTGTDDYRNIALHGGILEKCINNFVETIYMEGFMNNLCINVIIAAICLILFIKIKQEIKEKKVSYLIEFLTMEIFSYLIYTMYRKTELTGINIPINNIYFEAIFTLVTFICMTILVFFITLVYKKNIFKIVFIIGSIGLTIAPLFIVNPIGSRCFFASYILFIILICELLNIFPKKEMNKYEEFLIKCCKVLAIVIFAIYVCVFYTIYKVDRSRLRYIRNKVNKGKKTVEILYLPYNGFIWTGTPDEEPWITRYKLFYNIPEDVRINATYEYTKK